MRGLVAAFLIPLLVALPVTQVLGQATQQEPQVTQTDKPTVLLSAPVVDSNTVLLLAPGSVEFSPATDSLPLLESTATAIPKGAKTTLIVLGVILAVGALVFGLWYLAVCGQGCD
jgi:hypothetical protein